MERSSNHNLYKKWSLWLGTLFLFITFASGDQARDAFGRMPLIHFHENIASMCNVIFAILSIIYILGAPEVPLTKKIFGSQMLQKCKCLSIFLHNFRITLALALIGFLLIAATGAVGGSIRRGTDGDPLAKFVIEHWMQD